MGFGIEIKRLREDGGYSAQKLADAIGIDAERLRKWEQKDFEPRDDDRTKIEEYFGISLEQIEKLEKFPEDLKQKDYLERRRQLKILKKNTLTFYDVNAAAGVEKSEILPVKTSEGVLHISDLFKGSQYAIRISGNSMTPNYPAGAIIGIRQIEDKQITPGSVYVIEKGSDLWIKRLFYKDDNQESGYYECVSDNTMKFENGPRQGKYFYPPFFIKIDDVRKLFKVTGIYKPNELTVIN
jgi:phage repressor protein C with HTH and peptisase S24 domain